MSAIRKKTLKEKKALEEAYEESFDVIFNYGYAVVLLHIIFAKVNSKFWTGCLTRLSYYLRSFFINPRCPLGAIPVVAASIDVRPGEVMNVPKREAPAAILETDHNEEDEHLSTVEVGPGNELVFFA